MDALDHWDYSYDCNTCNALGVNSPGTTTWKEEVIGNSIANGASENRIVE